MTEHVSSHRYLRFLVSDRVLHLLLLISFTVLAITGLPQKYANSGWAVAMIKAMGGIEQTRVFHHTAAVILILTSIAHIVQVGYRMFVERKPLTMLPTLTDVTDFFDAIRYNMGFSKQPPRYARFNFIEKLEYWAVIWGTALMTVTGYFLWNPILVTQVLPGEWIPAAKIAHGMEAVLAVLSIVTWHSYFVHIAKFNKSIFNGYLSHDDMEEEHLIELEQRLEGRDYRPIPSDVRWRRLRVYVPLATLFVLISVVATWWWLTAEATAITTVPRIATQEKAYQPIGLQPLPRVTEREPLPTPPRVLGVAAQEEPPVIPHAIDGDRAQCNLCHALDSMIRPAPLSHEGFSESECTTCHVVGEPTPEPTEAAAQATLTPTPAEGGMPGIPHAIDGDWAVCTTCHAVGGGVKPMPTGHEVFDETMCLSCHQPISGAEETPAETGMPGIPHAIDGDWAVCTTCHVVGGGVKPMPTGHEGFDETMCLSCHQPISGAEETPAEGGAGTPAPPSAAAPVVPHTIAGEWANCSACHLVGGGMKPMPASHEAFSVELCLTCHQAGGTP